MDRFPCVTISVVSCVLGALGSAAAGRADDWPAFRGPAGDGYAVHADPPVHWSRDRHVRWRISLAGAGNGSPIVVVGRVLLNGASDLGRQRTLHCFDRADGRLLWSRGTAVEAIELTHKSNPYCGSTPASDGNVVVTWHGTGGLHCYSLDGEHVWSCDFGEIRHLWGYANSPIIFRDRVILQCGANPRMFVAAVRLADGAVLWETEEPGGQSNETPDGDMTGAWCTPVVARVAGTDQIICAMPTRVVAYDPDDGRILWTCDGLGSARGRLVYASPLVGDRVVVVMSGYMGPALGVCPDGSGDVTQTQRIWHVTEHNPQRIGSGVVVGEFVYIANADGGTIQCLELSTGRERWRQRVTGGPHWSSTIYAGGFLFATNQSGTTRVFRPDPSRFDLLAENPLDEVVSATPAFSDGEVFIRTDQHLYCIAHAD